MMQNPDAVPPEWMTDLQRDVWNDVILRLPHGVDLRTDRAMLSAFVVAQATYVAAAKLLKDKPVVNLAGTPGLVNSPFLGVVDGQARMISMLADGLGLSPAGRARMAKADPSRGETVGRLGFFNS